MSKRKPASAPRTSSQRFTFVERRSRDAFLASTAFTGAFVALIAGNPQSALAQCAISTGPNTVNCNANTTTTDTTNTNAATASSFDRHQRFGVGGAVTGTIQNGVTVDGFGLAIIALTSAAINVTNGGTVSVNNGNTPTAGGFNAALAVVAAGGNSTYGGNGSVISNNAGTDGLLLATIGSGTATVGTSGTRVTGTFTGRQAIAVQALNSNSSVFLNGGTVTGIGGINVITNGTDTASVDTTGGTVISAPGGFGIAAQGVGGGTAFISSDALIGTAGSRVDSGLLALVTGGIGAVTANQTGGSIFATNFGIQAETTGTGGVGVTTSAGSAIDAGGGTAIFATSVGTAGDVTVTTGGTITNANFGVAAHIGNAASAGNVIVTQNGSITAGTGVLATNSGTGSVTVTGSGLTTGTAGTGIAALQTNNAVGTSGGIHVGGSGSVNATGGIGIDADIQGANNAGNVLVDRTGSVTATGLFGIRARTAGNGNVTVTTAGTVTGSGGITAGSSLGSGAITVNVANDVTATAGVGVGTLSGNGANTVNVTGGTIHATGDGIIAFGGNSPITVNMTGGQVGTAAQRIGGIGIGTLVQGTAGDINVAANSVFSTGDGIRSTFANPASSGNVNVAINAGATVNSSAGIGVNLQNGNINTIANLGVISGTLAVQTATGATTVTNAGSMTGTGGTAVQLGGANNLFVMDGPAAALTGNAIGSGTDTFRLGGSGANSFNVAQIGTGWTLLDKAGASTWTLTGTSTYGGPTTVSAGTLLVNGSLASSSGITVAAGAALGGSGTLPSTTINGGTLSPGNSIGTITIAGNLTFVGAGNYVVEVSPAAADRTNATGTAALSGTLRAIGTGGTYTVGTRYTVLNATAGITGTFGLAASGNFGATKPHLEYDANNVYLVLDPNAISPFLVGGTVNQRNVAGAIDAALLSGSTAVPFLALFGLTAAQLPGALDQLSGEVHVSTASVLADESRYMREAVLGRLRQASYGGDANMASLSVGGPVAAFADGELDRALAYGKSPIVTKAPMKAPQAQADVVFWAQGFGASGRFETDGNAATLRRDLAGFISGVDTRVGSNGRLGVAAGYTGSKNNLDGRGGSDVETAHIAGYGGWNFGAFNLRTGGAYAFHSINTDRSIAFPGFFDRATARYDGNTGQVFGELGYGVAFGNVAFEPFAGGAWVRVQTDAAAERATAAGLNFAGTTFEVGYSTLGVRAASLVALENGMVLIPRGSLAWKHAFNSVTPDAVLAFQVAPAAPYTISGVPIARDALLAEAGLDLALSRNATLGVSYTGQVASKVQDHAAKGKFSWKF